MPKFSIIVPVYNAEKYLPKCVDSLLAQSVDNFELLLVNDGSKDGSLALCREYAAKDSRVKVYDKPNGGVSSARNYGLDNAQGEYIMFVDSDDWLSDDALAVCLPYIPEYDIVRFSATAVSDTRIRRYKLGKSSDKNRVMADIVARKTIVACYCGVYRRTLFVEHNIRFDSNIIIGEDWLVTAQLVKHCRNIKLLHNAYCYFYNKGNSDSCTLTLSPQKLMQQLVVCRMLRKMYDNGYAEQFRYTRCALLCELIDNCGMSDAARYLRDCSEEIDVAGISDILLSNISLRKRSVLLGFYLKGYLKGANRNI